jgi:hypothetical protein
MSLIKPEKMVDTTQFLQEVDQFSRATSCGYMDAVIHVAGLKGIEIETAAAMIKTSTKAKAFLQESAEDLNYMTRTSRLPV